MDEETKSEMTRICEAVGCQVWATGAGCGYVEVGTPCGNSARRDEWKRRKESDDGQADGQLQVAG